MVAHGGTIFADGKGYTWGWGPGMATLPVTPYG